MKRLIAIIMGICFIGTLGLVLGGCGQQTPTISTTNPQPAGLKIKGVIRYFTLNPITGGTVGDPLPNAYVSLSGDSANKTVITNANGEYLIDGIPDGLYVLVVTAEGYTRSSSNSVTIKTGFHIPADNTISVSDITLDSKPIILSFSPTPNSVVANCPTFTVTFDEAMDTTSVVPTLTPNGIRTYAAPSTVPLTATWNTANKVLTLIPQANLITNENYVLAINATATDTSGFAITNAMEQAQALTQNYRVTTGGVPTGSTELNLVVGTKVISSDAVVGVDFVDAFGAANVGFYWAPVSGVVTGYRIYIATEATGNYTLLATATGNVNYYDTTMAAITNALYGTGAVVNPLGTSNYPLINKTLYVKVVAYNGDGESAAVSNNFKELVGPRIDNAQFKKHGYAGAILENNYPLGSITSTNSLEVIYIGLKEPVDSSTITAANFSITGEGTSIVSATLMTQSTAALTTFSAANYAVVKIVTSANMGPTTQITMEAGVKDLAGNPSKAGVDETITLSTF